METDDEVADRALQLWGRMVADDEVVKQFVTEIVEPLRELARQEIEAGGSGFMGYPDRWYDGMLRRCWSGHVSRMVLKSEYLGRDACLACGGMVTMTFPEDKDGPLVIQGAK
jgi:hypothetical protein